MTDIEKIPEGECERCGKAGQLDYYYQGQMICSECYERLYQEGE